MDRRAALRQLASAVFGVAVSSAHAASIRQVGVVFMHGKWGSPDRLVNGLMAALSGKGFVNMAPEMPWSGRRAYDRSVDETMEDLTSIVGELKRQGATRIVVGGHSLGGAFALAYAGRIKVDGVMVIAPGHNPGAPRFRKLLGADVDRARAAVAAGKGKDIDTWQDLNVGDRISKVRASANAYLSYMDPDGPMNFLKLASGLKPDTPVLWAAPTREDSSFTTLSLKGYESLPPSPGHRRIEPDSDHLNAPSNVIPDVIDWLEKVIVPTT